MTNESKPNDVPVASPTPAKARPWSPWTRLGLLAIFISTLPFTWGETSSCNGPSHTYTGFEQATKPGNIIPFVVIFATPVLVGFVQLLARAAWVRLGFDLIAGMFASLGTLYCFLAAAIGGNLLSRSSRVFLAPWIATIALALIMTDAFWGAAQQLHTLLWARRRSANANMSPPEAPPSDSPERRERQ